MTDLSSFKSSVSERLALYEDAPGRTGYSGEKIIWKNKSNADSRSVIRFGVRTVCLGFGIFLLWALFFPLASAVVTPGTFVSEGKNKLVQHASGGRVREIFVAEGQAVSKGEAILSLDDTQNRAELTRLDARHASLKALKARLDAERSGGLRDMTHAFDGGKKSLLRGTTRTSGLALRDGAGRVFTLPDTLGTSIPASNNRRMPDRLITGTVDQRLASETELIESQRQAYVSGRKVLAQEIEALNKKTETLKKQREGLISRLESQTRLFDLALKEFNRLKPLASQGYVARNKLDERERTVLELQGTVASLRQDVRAADAQIAEMAIQVRKALSENSDVAAREYTKIVGEMAEISDQLIAARSAVEGALVRSPETGILTKLTVTTVGGVVGAGDRVAEIVPADAPLVVQARVAPGDIDYVQIGQKADIAVTAFNRRLDDMLVGRVSYKSADAEKDEKTGDSFFTVRLEVSGLKGIGRSRLGDIQAGMQSEIYIHTGSRTFMTYLAKPMIDSFRRAFREQ